MQSTDKISDAIRTYYKELRIHRGMTQEHVANLIDMNPRTYLAWESGKINDIKSAYFLRLVYVLGGDQHWLSLIKGGQEGNLDHTLSRYGVDVSDESLGLLLLLNHFLSSLSDTQRAALLQILGKYPGS